MRKTYKNGWLNGFNIDVDIYTFKGVVCFRIWRDNAYDIGMFPQQTLGM